jgi:SMODS and SLOG-associating 2TM effector domain 1
VAAGGSGAILAAAGVEVWIGLTTAISAAALSYLAYLQVDNTIVAYNQAASTLTRLEREWAAGDHEGDDREAFDDLVARGEAVLTTELGGSVQQMTVALDRLHAQQATAARRVDGPEHRQPN